MDRRVLVIVVTYNGEKWINRCFDSVVNCENTTLFVVDNNSTDNTVDIIRAEYPDVILKVSDKNLGFGGANNIGLEYAIESGFDYVYLLNQDAWVMRDTINTLVDIQKANKSYGILSPLQTNAKMDKLDFGLSKVLSENSNALSDYIFGRSKELYDVDFVMAAHWLISRDCLMKVGKFSPVFFHYGEDNNYLHRVKYHGFKIGVVTSTLAVHDREFRVMTKERDIYSISVLFRCGASNINQPYVFATIKSLIVFANNAALRSLRYKNILIFLSIVSRIFELPKIYMDRKRNKSICKND